jgi:serine/threonine-protein kinase
MTDADGLALPPLLAGRYQVLRRIGAGSIAQVVAARDLTSGIVVALKVLYPNLLDDPAVADRFRREVQVVRRIDHPHVVRIHDLVSAGDLVFLVMELHAGGDLADRLARGGPLPAVETLCRQLCGALEAAHRAGVIHRDVKPQNILVGEGELDARLCDFGLARTADLAGLTTRTTVLGTPAYMAPEVISDGYADPRSDLYSLGVVLFEAATGRLPFQGDSPYQLLRQHLTAPAPRARSLAPELSVRLDEVIARALAKDPLDRFSSAAEMAAALDGGAERPAVLEVRRVACPRCQGEVVSGVCVDCAAASLSLRSAPGGVAVLITGPGEAADKLDGGSYVALIKLLDELPAEGVVFDRLRRRPPRLPFYCAARLSQDSAEALVARLHQIGLAARITAHAGIGSREVRDRMFTMVGRSLLVASTGAVSFMWLFRHMLWFAPDWFLPILMAAGAVPVLAPVLTALRPAVRLRGQNLALPARLTSTLGRLSRREDRRLVARVLDRLGAASRLGGAALAEPLMARAAQAAEALIEADTMALDAGELQRAAARGDEVGEALDRLRETERVRAVLVADLLRTFARLDLFCLKLGRAAGLDAVARARALGEDVAALESELAAEVDLGRLLEAR